MTMRPNKAIAEYMEAQNRPYSVQNLIDNLQGRIKKTQTQRICDELVADKILVLKEYGKAKIYVINQDLYPDTSTEDLEKLDDQIKVRKEEMDKFQAQLKELQAEFKKITIEPTNQELDDMIKKLEKEESELSKKVSVFENKKTKTISEEDMKKIEQKCKVYETEWKKRKRGCMDMINTISDGMDKNKKDLIEEIGIETDEDLGVTCP